MSEPIKKCNNCEKEILESKFPLHEPFCIRNIIKCELCGEPVTKDELDDHHAENHKLSDCSDCGKRMEKRVLYSHKKKCMHKPVVCQYCSLEVPKNEIHDHEYMCGSKTENCHLCGEPVPIMEYDLHVEYTCKGENNHKSDLERKNESTISNVSNKENRENKKFKPPSKKLNFEEYSRNLENLKREFQKTDDTIRKTNQAVNLNNSSNRNHLSNNVKISNRKIDEFIDLSEDVDEIVPPKNGPINNINNKNIGKKKPKVNFKQNSRAKRGVDAQVGNSTLNHSHGEDFEFDGDVLQAVLEMSKHEK